MSKLFTSLISFGILLGGIYLFRDEISDFVYENIILKNIEISTPEHNDYYLDNDYEYVQLTDDFVAKDKQHLLNIYYTIVDNGNEDFTFLCSQEYTNCLDDIAEISRDQSYLSNINSFVHPFNSFESIETQYDSLGKIVVKVNKAYTQEEIEDIEQKIQTINKKIGKKKNKRDMIKAVHDYVINNTKYDSDRSDKKIVNYKSDIAYGPLFQGYGLCGGYTDTMALFLDYYNIPNIKVSSENHIWNAVYLDNKWYHLDLTWDDPVDKNNKDILEYTFFLITTKELNKIEKEQHIFDTEVFKELL